VTEEIPCPACGYRMVPRPYSYQYFVPVDKCLSCSKIWFDADELEILQILIEDRGA
jgi:Zn-finger nucleic acid-binding protein